MADLLQLLDGVAGADVPVEEVDVLHEPDGVSGEAEAEALRFRPAPHVVAGIAQPPEQDRRELAHHEGQIVGHPLPRSPNQARPPRYLVPRPQPSRRLNRPAPGPALPDCERGRKPSFHFELALGAEGLAIDSAPLRGTIISLLEVFFKNYVRADVVSRGDSGMCPCESIECQSFHQSSSCRTRSYKR